MALLSKKMRKRRGQLERGIKGGWSESHKKRARDELAKIMATRKRISENRTLYNPAASLSGQQLRGFVDSMVESEVAPLRRQATGLEALGSRLGGNVNSVYMGIAQQAAQQAAQMQALGEKSVAGAQAGTKATADALGQVQESVGSSLGRIEDERAVPFQQSALDALAENRAQAIRAGQASENQTRASAEANKSFLAEMAASTAASGGQYAADIARTTQGRVGDVMAEIANVQGPGRTKLLGEMREGERRWLGEQAAFGIDRAKLQADAQESRAKLAADRAENRRDQRNKDRQYQFDREKFGADRADEMWDRRHPKGGAGGRTPSQVRSDKVKRNKARASVKAFAEQHPAIKLPSERGKKLRERAINGLMADHGYSRREARRIVTAQTRTKKQKVKKRYTTAGS
jgi:hypothetical protein